MPERCVVRIQSRRHVGLGCFHAEPVPERCVVRIRLRRAVGTQSAVILSPIRGTQLSLPRLVRSPLSLRPATAPRCLLHTNPAAAAGAHALRPRYSLRALQALEEVLPEGTPTPRLAALYLSHGQAMLRMLRDESGANGLSGERRRGAQRQVVSALGAALKIRRVRLRSKVDVDEHRMNEGRQRNQIGVFLHFLAFFCKNCD